MRPGQPKVNTRLASRPSSTDTAKSTARATSDELPLATNRQAGSLDPTDGMDRMTRGMFGPPSTTDGSQGFVLAVVFLGLMAYPVRARTVLLSLALLGDGIEVAQWLTGWRTGDWQDWIADCDRIYGVAGGHSPQTLYVKGIGQTRVCDFFVNFRQLNRTHLGQLMGHWGALSSVGQGNSGELWLNTKNGGLTDFGICVPARLVDALYERHAIHSGSAWEPESCFALVVGTVHLSQWGKPYIKVADLCNVAVLQRGASAGQR